MLRFDPLVSLRHVPQAVCRFPATLRQHLDTAGERARERTADPGAHDERTVAAVRSAPGGVVETG